MTLIKTLQQEAADNTTLVNGLHKRNPQKQ